MKDSSNRKVFSWCWNDRSVDAETTVSGNEFDLCGGNRKSSAADGRKFKMRYVQAIGACVIMSRIVIAEVRPVTIEALWRLVTRT